MFEWLDGYWTAARHISAFTTPDQPVVTIADWTAAVGSVLAGGGAAVAAWLTWRIAKESMASKIETERASVIFLISEITTMILSNARIAQQNASSMKHERIHKDLVELWDEQIEIFKNIHNECMKEFDAIRVHNKLLNAKTIEDIQYIKMGIAGVKMTVSALDVSLSAAQYHADLIRKGTKR